MGFRDWYFIAEQAAPAPHLAHPEGLLPYALCYLLCPVPAALANIVRLDSISTSYNVGFRVSGFGVRMWGFKIQGSRFRVLGSGFRVHDSGFRVQGSGFRVQGSGV